MQKSRDFMIAAVGLIGLLLLGCAPSEPLTPEAIAGLWQCVSRPWVIEFRGDQHIRMRTIGAPLSGTYRLDEGGRLRVFMHDGRRFQAHLTLRNQKLRLTDPDGATSTFKRF